MKKAEDVEECSLAFETNDYYQRKITVLTGLMADLGATSHIIRDAKKFKYYDQTFQSENRYMELADITKPSVKMRRRMSKRCGSKPHAGP